MGIEFYDLKVWGAEGQRTGKQVVLCCNTAFAFASVQEYRCGLLGDEMLPCAPRGSVLVAVPRVSLVAPLSNTVRWRMDVLFVCQLILVQNILPFGGC